VRVGRQAATGTAAKANAEAAAEAGIPRQAWIVFGAGALAMAQSGLALSIMNVAFPSLRTEFTGTSASTLSWVINLYTIVAAATLVVSGALVDRLGAKRVVILGGVLFAAAALCCGLAPNIGVLLAARVVQATGSAMLTPSCTALIVGAFPDSHRATAVAGYAATGSIASGFGPTLGGLLVDAGGWRWAFYAMVPGGVIGAVLVALLVADTRTSTRRPVPDLIGVGLIITSVGLVISGLVETRSWGWGDPRVLLAIAVGLGLGVVLVHRSLRHPAPALDLTLFRHPSFAAANLGTFVFSTGFFGVFFGYPLFLTDVWGYGARTAGLLMTPIAACGVIVAPLAGRVIRARGLGALLVPAGALVAAGSLLLLVAADSEPDMRVWLPGIFLTGIGASAAWPCFYAGVVADVPSDRYAAASGINQTIQRTGTAFGVALAVTLLGTTKGRSGVGSFDRIFALAMVSGLLTIAMSRVFARRDQPNDRSPAMS
jgi:EmrB/QacA subfamily drug resistance transporter